MEQLTERNRITTYKARKDTEFYKNLGFLIVRPLISYMLFGVTCVTANNGCHRSIMFCFIFNVEVLAVMRGTCLGGTLRVTCVTANNGFSVLSCFTASS